MDDQRTFKQHHRTITDAVKSASRDLRLIVGVEVRLKRDKWGVATECWHPKKCPCGECK